MSLLIKNIKKLIQCRTEDESYVSGKDMSSLPSVDNAFLYIENDKIIDFGEMEDCLYSNVEEVYDAK